jgi:hypothetical protein
LPVAQSGSPPHVVLHALPLHWYEPQLLEVPGLHVPPPHVPAAVCIPAMHVCMPHIVPGATWLQWPAPSQVPVLPHIAGVHWFAGSGAVPILTGPHWPSIDRPVSAFVHASHVLPQL